MDVSGHLFYHTDKQKRKRFSLFLLAAYGVEEVQAGCAESFLLDEIEEDHSRHLQKNHWSVEAAIPGAGKAFQLLAKSFATTFKRLTPGFSVCQ